MAFIANFRGHSPVPASPSSNHIFPRVKPTHQLSNCLGYEGKSEEKEDYQELFDYDWLGDESEE